ncbi:MAG: hypothetical protein V4726_05305 [Verrucomicrobiota bacterium]
MIWSVRALSQPSSVQKGLFPAFSVPADELALTFEEFLKSAEALHAMEWTDGQRRALGALDEKLEAMSGPGKDEIWIARDCLTHPQWAEVRSLAQKVLLAFNWPSAEPASFSCAQYISESGELWPPL